MAQSSVDFHVEYLEIYRHWHSGSEQFASGDALVTALQDGWKLLEPVYEEKYWHAGTRLVVVYHGFLERDGERMLMPVISNPFIRRGILQRGTQVRPYEELVALQRRARLNSPA